MCTDDNYDNPFADDKLPGLRENLPGLGAASPDAQTDSPLDVTPEIWSGKNVYDIAIPLHQMNEGYAGAVARNWAVIAGKLSERHQAFLAHIGSRDLDHWQGQGSDAVNDAMRDYAASLRTLADRADFMSSVVQHGADTVNRVKNSIPTEQEVNEGIAPLEPSEQRSTLDHLTLYAQDVMKQTYNSGVTQAAQAAPVFGAPTKRANPDMLGSTGAPTGGGSSSTGGIGAGAGGGGGAASMPTSGVVPKLPSLDKSQPAAKAPSPADPGGVPGALTSGLSQASNLGQSAAGQAQNAASKLAALAKSPLRAATGLHALNAAKKASGMAGLAKAGGGGAGKSGGSAGAAGVGKLAALAKPLSDAEKTALSRGVTNAMNAEKNALSAARGATPSAGGGPMGGAGARGAGGEDKEHKTNKFLRTTLNGEVLIGTPPVVTAAVIKET